MYGKWKEPSVKKEERYIEIQKVAILLSVVDNYTNLKKKFGPCLLSEFKLAVNGQEKVVELTARKKGKRIDNAMDFKIMVG